MRGGSYLSLMGGGNESVRMQSEDADIAVPIIFVLLLIVGIGVHHSLTAETPRLNEAQIKILLEQHAEDIKG